jgi:hypothetical protein
MKKYKNEYKVMFDQLNPKPKFNWWYVVYGIVIITGLALMCYGNYLDCIEYPKTCNY